MSLNLETLTSNMAENLESSLNSKMLETMQSGNDSTKSLLSDTLDGVHESSTYLNDISVNTGAIAEDVGAKGWFYSTLSEMLEMQSKQSDQSDEFVSFRDKVSESLEQMNLLDQVESSDKKKEKAKKGKIDKNTSLKDLKDLPYEFATLGAVLSNSITSTAEKKEKGGGISGFFKGLLEGVSGIASLGVALLAFAGATLLFNFVNWGQALTGLVAFTAFTIGMVTLAKLLGKQDKSFTEFTKASILMSAALGVFAVSLWITSAIMSGEDITDVPGIKVIPGMNIAAAFAGLGMFMAFELGIVMLSKLVGNSAGDIKNFAIGSILMTAALAAFAVSLWITSSIMQAKEIPINDKLKIPEMEPSQAMIGVGMFLAFELGLAVVARVAGGQTGNFTKFAIASIAMCGALIAFSLSLVIVSKLLTTGFTLGQHEFPKVDPASAILGLGSFLVFIIAFTVLANVANNFMGQIALFAGVSVLMSAALMVFSMALTVAGVAAYGGEAEILGKKFVTQKDNGAKALLAIPLLAAFMASFAGLGALFMVPFAGAAMLAGIGIATTILLAIGATMIVMAKAIALSSIIATGGTMEWAGQKFVLAKAASADDIEKSMSIVSTLMKEVTAIGNEVKRSGLDKKTVKLLSDIVDVIAEITSVVVAAMTMKAEVVKKGGVWDVTLLNNVTDPLLYILIGKNLDGKGGLVNAAVALQDHDKQLKTIVRLLDPIVDTIDKMIDVVVKAANKRKSLPLDENGKLDTSIIDGVSTPVLQILMGQNLDGNGGLVAAANELKARSALSLMLVTQSMLPVAQTIDTLIGAVETAATLGGRQEEAKAMIDLAVSNMSYLMVGEPVEKGGFFGKKELQASGGFIGMFNIIAASIKSMKKGAMESIQSLPAVADTVKTIVDSMLQIGDKSNELLKARATVDAVLNFWGDDSSGFKKMLSELADGSWKAKDYNKMSETLDAATSAVSSLKKLSSAMGGDFASSLANLSLNESSSKFEDNMKNFYNGAKYIGKAYDVTKDIDNSWIDRMSQAINTIGDTDLANLDRITAFTAKNTQLKQAADQMERIANSMKKISAADKIGNAVDSFTSKLGAVFSLGGKTIAEQKGATAVAQSMSSSVETVAQGDVFGLLESWNRNGVPIVPKNSTEKGPNNTIRI